MTRKDPRPLPADRVAILALLADHEAHCKVCTARRLESERAERFRSLTESPRAA